MVGLCCSILFLIRAGNAVLMSAGFDLEDDLNVFFFRCQELAAVSLFRAPRGWQNGDPVPGVGG